MTATIHTGDALATLRTLPADSVHACVTSPPYWALRSYLPDDHPDKAREIGLEQTPDQFVEALVAVFDEVRRVLRDDGSCWVNMGYTFAAQGGGDPYSGLNSRWKGTGANGKQDMMHGAFPKGKSRVASGWRRKECIPIPWLLGLAMHDAGWWLRFPCVWAKPNPMPSSAEDRPTLAHEDVLLFTKRPDYFYDSFAVRQPYADSTLPQKGRPYGGVATKDYAQGRAQDPSETKRRVVESLERRGGANLRSVWTVPTQPFKGAHSATFPKALADRCILAGTSAHGCCEKCGAPWERVVETGYENPGNRSTNGPRSAERKHVEYGSAGFEKRLERRDESKGWRPTCECGAAVVPCRVLDPFTGAGPTGLAATLLGRDFVGVELNPEFAAMARKRVADEMPLFARAAGGGA